ncbi:protein kinase [uncultured Nocardioides sp.]|uniref:protein kinase domain-containing protein n=1 Tax=uncultured Nocardioides sp. TaxID=198441 RepID=UPI00262B8C85|nr:protein kinase [uncultured Nocardioides sp.]
MSTPHDPGNDPSQGPSQEPARFVDDQHRYRLESRIATGGMGEVWRASDTALGREVAVKVLKSEYADDALFRTRFETEARHAASLHHPGVASVYDVGESALLGREDGSAIPRPFLVMELVDGQPLSALLRGGRPLDPSVVRDLMAQAADAIGAAHQAGIVHRDVKPANLLVTPDRRIKITDFGIARASDGLGLTGTGQVMGTPQYLSPEQARGAVATPASDVYSLGVVAFECLAGRRPFDADSPVATALAHLNEPVPDLPRSVPADLATVVRRALAKDPADRYADGDALAVALRDPAAAAAAYVPPSAEDHTQVMGAVPPVAPAPTPVADPEPDEERRSAWPIVLLVIGLVAAILLIVWLIASANDGDDEPSDTGSTSASVSSSAPSSADTPSQETSSAPAEVQINAQDYLGRPVDEVSAELRAKGLEVDARPVDNPGGKDADTVAAVRPTAGLVEGDTVIVEFYREAEPTTPPPSSDTGSPTPSDTSTPSTSNTPSPSASADGQDPTTSDPASVSAAAAPASGPTSGGAR